ncbi:hypothetical protein BD414DRAFT_311664 [Trametes punicea]|nr:hypothetical protein BD414DRAFT_311664 [Trametes punicea]
MSDDEKIPRSGDKSGAEAELTVVGPPSVVDDRPEPNTPRSARPARELDLEYVPDGGKEAWVVVLGSSLALFASAGMINAYVRPAFSRVVACMCIQ